MARKEFRLPDVGEGVAEGELVSWLVEVGDPVEEDQPVAEVETDKALVEIPSPYDGVVAELRAEPGDVVPVGAVLLAFEVEDDAAAGSVEVREADSDEGAAESGGAAASERRSASGDGAEPDREPEPGAPADEGAPDAAETDPSETRIPGRVFAPPSARRLARELDVDLGAISGSGPGGRITEADVRAAVEGARAERDGVAEIEREGRRDERREEDDRSDAGDERAAWTPDEATGTSDAVATAAGRDRTLAAPATRRLAEELDVDIDDVPAVDERDGESFVTPEAVREYAETRRAARVAEVEATADIAASADEAPGEDAEGPAPGAATGDGRESAARQSEAAGPTPGERIPYRGVRRTIGEQMERSAYTAPHVTHHDWADVTDLVALREEFKPLAAERGVRLTYLPFALKAVVAALREFPYLNATLDEEAEEIVLHDEYHVGFATATDAGLVVPVVEDVDEKSLFELARAVAERAERARDRRITRDEMRGGTFTVTNVGAIGGEYATPIINYPEVAILALGAVRKRPVVVDRRDGDAAAADAPSVAEDGSVPGAVVPRYTLPLSLSIDHRVVDGATAAEFTNYLIESLGSPKRLLVE